MSALGWRARAMQWMRVARKRNSVDERAAAVKAARYCHGMFIREAYHRGGAAHAPP